jgi:hypothetical protein
MFNLHCFSFTVHYQKVEGTQLIHLIVVMIDDCRWKMLKSVHLKSTMGKSYQLMGASGALGVSVSLKELQNGCTKKLGGTGGSRQATAHRFNLTQYLHKSPLAFFGGFYQYKRFCAHRRAKVKNGSGGARRKTERIMTLKKRKDNKRSC